MTTIIKSIKSRIDNIFLDEIYSKNILKPLDSNNIKNSCWINSALYLISAHPYIMFQYLLFNDEIVFGIHDIYKEIYINNIIYNYKYIKSENNKHSKIYYNESLHKNLYDKIKQYEFIKMPEWGQPFDAQLTLNLLYTIITKQKPKIDKNVYLTIETSYLSSTEDINKILFKKDSNKSNKLLLGFVIGTECNKYNIHDKYLYDKDLSTVHWISYIRNTLNNDNDWYKFDAQLNKGEIINKEKIYDCSVKGYNKNLMCIYIDINKFKEILSNNNNIENYENFINSIEPLSNIDNKLQEKIEKISNNIKKNPDFDIKKNINLLSIQDLEEIYKDKINNFYYKIEDKRAYFINLN